MSKWGWKSSMYPHLTLEGALRASRGWLDHARSEMERNHATEMRLTVGEDPTGIYFNQIEFLCLAGGLPEKASAAVAPESATNKQNPVVWPRARPKADIGAIDSTSWTGR